MLHSSRLLKRPKSLRSLTGLTPEAFEKLALEVAFARGEARAKKAASRPRRRKVGGGPKFRHDTADRLLMVLVYYRTYITQEFLGVLFGVDASTVNRALAEFHPLLASVFRIPEKRIEMAADEVRELFFDGTEQSAYRPERGQRQRYSGKKQQHTFKHQVVVARVRKKPGRGKKKRRVRIKAVSAAHPGKVHDKKVYTRSRMRIPAGVPGTGDSGYQGTSLETPRKKPRGRELTRRRKAGNRRLSRRRIVVEHGIGKMKIWRSCQMRFRNDPRRKTVMFKNVAGLHNRMFG